MALLVESASKIPYLVFDYIEQVDFGGIFIKLIEEEIRFYFDELMKTLEFYLIHTFIHRDVKTLKYNLKSIKKLLKWLAESYYIYGSIRMLELPLDISKEVSFEYSWLMFNFISYNFCIIQIILTG